MSPIMPPGLRAREEARRMIEREVIARHAQERAAAGFWRRLLIAIKVQREILAELRRRFPPDGMYHRQT